MTMEKYEPRFGEGRRMQLIGREHHSKNGQRCRILATLPNPSRRSEHQWYDVRFDDYTSGRFLERFLHADESPAIEP
jgi:hypothetical protein